MGVEKQKQNTYSGFCRIDSEYELGIPPERHNVFVIGRLLIFELENYRVCLDMYANTMCPLSQMIIGESVQEIKRKYNELKVNFMNPSWVNEYLSNT